MMERLDRFMARAGAAYYARHDPFANFTTAPEITQVFGEILGLWAAVVWQAMGRPDPVIFAEAGPGRGTLMADALRAVTQVAPEFAGALRLHLIETSPRLRARQAQALPAATFHATLEELPDGQLILLANEFLDALPIRQFIRRDGQWMERCVDAARFVETPVVEPPEPELPGGAALLPLQDGYVIERGEAALAFIRSLGRRLHQQGGAALLLDYGPGGSAPGDSLQALRDGRPADPLADPGDADLTAHVDFAGLAAAAGATGCTVHGPLPQGVLLVRLGLFQRVDRLARGRTPAEVLALIDAARRLAEPDRMGRLFKALALCHPDVQTPPGFEGADAPA
jgi:SAM-dependent MidA family methyltransferase